MGITSDDRFEFRYSDAVSAPSARGENGPFSLGLSSTRGDDTVFTVQLFACRWPHAVARLTVSSWLRGCTFIEPTRECEVKVDCVRLCR